jgi:hypothetical protein
MSVAIARTVGSLIIALVVSEASVCCAESPDRSGINPDILSSHFGARLDVGFSMGGQSNLSTLGYNEWGTPLQLGLEQDLEFNSRLAIGISPRVTLLGEYSRSGLHLTFGGGTNDHTGNFDVGRVAVRIYIGPR